MKRIKTLDELRSLPLGREIVMFPYVGDDAVHGSYWALHEDTSSRVRWKIAIADATTVPNIFPDMSPGKLASALRKFDPNGYRRVPVSIHALGYVEERGDPDGFDSEVYAASRRNPEELPTISLEGHVLHPNDGISEGEVIEVGRMKGEPVIYRRSCQVRYQDSELLAPNYFQGREFGLTKKDIGRTFRLVNVTVRE